MMQVLVSPAVLSPNALAGLKAWLGVTSTVNDAVLSDLLAAALEVCAAFTGMMPLACGIEETLTVATGPEAGPDWRWARDARWQTLVTRPVIAVTAVSQVAVDGTRTALDPAAYTVRIDAEGTCRVRVHAAGMARCVVAVTAGLAADWAALPRPLREGIVCLAGSQFQGGVGQAMAPPASVTALWLPWRRVRLT